MALYTTVRRWVNYRNAEAERAIRRAIEAAVERAPDRVEPHNREAIRGYAARVAAAWHFVEGFDAEIIGGFAFWGGWVRNREVFLIRDQIEAIAAILRPEHDRRSDGLVGCGLQGLFDVVRESGSHVEWRLSGGAVHVNEREVPLSAEQRIG